MNLHVNAHNPTPDPPAGGGAPHDVIEGDGLRRGPALPSIRELAGASRMSPMGLFMNVSGGASRPVATRVLARLATSGIYLVRGVPWPLQRAARVRAVSENTTLRWVLVQALREYAAGAWTPRPNDKSPECRP